MIDSTHYIEIHLIDQSTQKHTIIQLGGQLERGQGEWVLDETGVDYSRFRFVGAADGVHLEYLEGDSTVLIDGAPVSGSALIRDGALLRIDEAAFRCELRQQSYDSVMPAIDGGWMSITGSVRDHNEDAIGIYQKPPYYLFAVADGVGGAEAGEIISEFAIKYILHTYDKYLGPQTDWSSVFRTAVKAINDEARRYAAHLSERSGKRLQAGCTLTIIAINGWDALVTHVGDSRLYLMHNGHLQQVSVDHSTFPTESLQSANPSQTMLTKRNVLIKGIGKSDMIEPDLKPMRLAPGDKLLLCSDGMSDRIKDPEIAGLLEGMPLQKLVAHLAKTADERRSGDNISVIALHITTPGQAAPQGQPMPQPRAFIGPQPMPRLMAVAETSTEYSTETGDSRLSPSMIIPVVIVVLIVVIVILLATRSAG